MKQKLWDAWNEASKVLCAKRATLRQAEQEHHQAMADCREAKKAYIAFNEHAMGLTETDEDDE